MAQPQWVKRCMDLAIERVRYENAVLSLSDSRSNDTQAIRDATETYTNSWIIPLLKAVRDGDRVIGEAHTKR